MKSTRGKVVLQLVGIDGNAFALMGAFKQAARRQGWTPEEIKSVLDECLTGDYSHLLCTLMDNTTSPNDEEEEEKEEEEEEDEENN